MAVKARGLARKLCSRCATHSLHRTKGFFMYSNSQSVFFSFFLTAATKLTHSNHRRAWQRESPVPRDPPKRLLGGQCWLRADQAHSHCLCNTAGLWQPAAAIAESEVGVAVCVRAALSAAGNCAYTSAVEEVVAVQVVVVAKIYCHYSLGCCCLQLVGHRQTLEAVVWAITATVSA